MVGITTTNTLASCLHSMTGSTSVFAESGGISKPSLDGTIVGGSILGLGSSTVFCEGMPMALAGSIIAPHGECTAIPPVLSHCTAITTGTITVGVGI